MSDIALLSLIIFLPTIGALFLALFNKQSDGAMRTFGHAVTLVTFALSLLLWSKFDSSIPGIQMAVKVPWISAFNINYQLGVDGISMPLVVLTTFISWLSMLASTSITKQVRGYLMLFLLLETGMLGVFMALDFVLFYVFWEVMLLPMYFLIGVWGGPRREYAAIKFFLYTLVGGVLMFIAMLMLYFDGAATAYGKTFDILQLSLIGQVHSSAGGQFSEFIQKTAFVLLFIGFAIKVPVWPFHTWLPDAHVEAPTPISMILAGVLLKMGGYGIIRIAFPICPVGAYWASHALVVLGVISIIYGAFAALAQTDFKRMVAYSSVSHMGYVLLGIAVWTLGEGTVEQNTTYWNMGLNAAMFQMLAHGISSPGMFFMVGVIYDRVHHRDLNQFGGLMGLMPLYGGLAVGIFFAGMGLPGLCGFWGEAIGVVSTWNYSPLYSIIAASGVILTAAYILWAVQRVYLGPEYKGPHPEAITPITEREVFIGATLLVFCIILGVYPNWIFSQMHASINHLVNSLTTPELIKQIFAAKEITGL